MDIMQQEVFHAHPYVEYFLFNIEETAQAYEKMLKSK